MNDNEIDIPLEQAIILLCYVPGAIGFYKRNSIRHVDKINRENLFSLCLIDSPLESCRRTNLGDNLILKFVDYWNDSYYRPRFFEKPFGTLRELFDRDSDFNERFNELIQERSGKLSTAQPNQDAQPDQEQTDTAEQTDTPNQEQPRAASSSIEKNPPKQPRADVDSSEQPKRKKASKNDVLGAMALLRKRAETPNITDWEKGTIILFLRDKKYNLELSKKTKIGKYWAIIYDHKKDAPPPQWNRADIQQALEDLASDGINFDWFL